MATVATTTLVLAIFAGAAAVQPPDASGAERGFLYHIVEMDPVSLDSTAVVGSLSGRRVKVEIEKASNAAAGTLRISAALGDNSLGAFSLPVSDLPKIDLSTAQFYGRKSANVVHVELRFGDRTECFVNDDGRGRLTVQFESGSAPRAFITRYPSCEPDVIKLPRAQQ